MLRRIVFCLAVAAALAVPAVASAQDAPPNVICGGSCDWGGGGWTGCTSVTGQESGGVWGIAGWHHYLVVYYCKFGGVLTQLTIVAHGCDTSGFAFCNVGPAWLDSGWVGTGWAYLQGRAYYGTTINRVTGLSYTSNVQIWIPLG
jgi:hypothetical protein